MHVSDHDIHQADSYAVHLAEVNQTHQVLATEDIHNEKGVLLVRKGHAIKSETAQRLLNHRLLRPLDTSISISDTVDGRRIYADIITLLQRDPESHAIHQALNLEPALKHVCFQLKTYPLVAQKITVLALRLTDEYHKSLYCAWMSLALSVQLRTDELNSPAAFLAGLTHNTGLLHIDPAIVSKTGSYSPDEWRAVQSHPLIGEMFLTHVPGLDPSIARAVREHHERCDGSGYPAALWEERLSLLGQVVAVADTTWGICKPPAEGKYQGLADVLTIIKMNRAQFPTVLESALYHLQYRALQFSSGWTPPRGREHEEPIKLQQLQRDLEARYQITAPLRPLLEPQANDVHLRGAYVRSQRIWFVVNGSGLLCKELTDSDSGEDFEPPDDYTRYELALMLSELRWQFFQLERSLQQLIRFGSQYPAALKEKVEHVLAELRRLDSQARLPIAPGESTERELRWTVR